MARMSTIETLARALEQAPGVRLAVLFGSAARGTERPDSDLDVGVRLAEQEADPYGNLLAAELERATGRTIDLVLLDAAPPLLRFEIAREGRVLVEHHPGDWTAFRARAMVDWWDWAPTARMIHRVTAERLRTEVANGQA